MHETFENWVLLRGSRYVVAGSLLAVVAVIVLPVMWQLTIRNVGSLYYLCSGLITGNVTLITVVVAINQVILSRELESPGELLDEIEQTAEYRQSTLGRSLPPTEASSFLRDLARQGREDARAVTDAGAESADRKARQEIDRLVSNLEAHYERIDQRFDDGGRRIYTLIDPVLGEPYAEYAYRARCIRTLASNDDRRELASLAEQLLDDIERLDVTRQYFATMVIKEELAKVS